MGYHSHYRPILTYISFWTFWLIFYTVVEGSLLHKPQQLAQHGHTQHSPHQHTHMLGSVPLCCDRSLRLLFHLPSALNFWPHWSHQNLTWLPCLGVQSGLLVWTRDLCTRGIQGCCSGATHAEAVQARQQYAVIKQLFLQMLVSLVWVMHLSRSFHTLSCCSSYGITLVCFFYQIINVKMSRTFSNTKIFLVSTFVVYMSYIFS